MGSWREEFRYLLTYRKTSKQCGIRNWVLIQTLSKSETRGEDEVEGRGGNNRQLEASTQQCFTWTVPTKPRHRERESEKQPLNRILASNAKLFRVKPHLIIWKQWTTVCSFNSFIWVFSLKFGNFFNYNEGGWIHINYLTLAIVAILGLWTVKNENRNKAKKDWQGIKILKQNWLRSATIENYHFNCTKL